MTDATAPVSVIIPCFLCRETIERALLSVLQQTMQPSEVLLVDDASPDDGATVRELQTLADLHGSSVPIRVVQCAQNGGPGNARNRGWALSNQPFIAFLDSDDAWLPKKIETQYTWMRDHPEVFLTCHRHGFADGNASALDASTVQPGTITARPVDGKSLLYSNAIATRTVMLRRDVPHRFKEGKRYAEDFLLWLELVLGGIRAAKLDSLLAVAFKGDFGAGGLSANLVCMEFGELDCYRQLYKAELIGLGTFLSCSIFSLVKFLRRVLVVRFREIL
ncbi:glycosyltransferase family 2 protein [Hydrogenophaga sp.]|uniref:glycosyltransferase family 2 protein n=1 Tax=Hydrogenophaga sp. TaxID=1904254 RepID=UPI003D0C1D05